MFKVNHIMLNLLAGFYLCALMSGCTTVSRQVRSEAEPPVAYAHLLQEADAYKGKTVILGGYILDVKNTDTDTTFKILQAPLSVTEEPKSKDESAGRFIIYYKDFLDPEVYAKNRKITVAGRVLGITIEKIGNSHIRYLEIENREIHLWPEYQSSPPRYDPWYYNPYGYHYRYFPYRYYW